MNTSIKEFDLNINGISAGKKIHQHKTHDHEN